MHLGKTSEIIVAAVIVAILAVSVAYLTFFVLPSGHATTVNTLPQPDISCTAEKPADCSYANLRYADFSNLDLNRANFTGADLRNVKFNFSDLENATFTGANIANADFTNADLLGASIPAASLGVAILCDTIMPDGSVSDADCSS